MRLPFFAPQVPVILLAPLDLLTPPIAIYPRHDRPRRGAGKDWLKPVRNSRYMPHQGQRERDRHRRR